MTSPMNKFLARATHIANRCREQKGWKPDSSIFMRDAKKEDVGSLYIYAPIGDSFWSEGVTATSVQKALDGLKGVKTLNIFINSEGGDVFDGKAIYTQLKRFNAKKVVHIDGLAASAASFIAMAGDEIITAPAATWMIHQAWGWAIGNADEIRDYADVLEMLSEDIINIYTERTGRSIDEVRALVKAETWMNAEQALKEKFTDSIASYDDGEDSEEEEKNMLKSPGLARIAASTTARVSSSMSELLQFKAKRAREASEAKAVITKNTTRTSAGLTRNSASR